MSGSNEDESAAETAATVPDPLVRVMLYLTAHHGHPVEVRGGHYEWLIGEPDDDGEVMESVAVEYGPDAENPEGLVTVMVFGFAAYAFIGCCVEHGVAYRNADQTIAAWQDEAKRKPAQEAAAAASRAQNRPKVVPTRPGGGEGGGAS
jgi:hypothetical protein